MLVDPIAALRSQSGSLVSLYLDRPSPGGMGALLTDLLKPVREAAEIKGRAVQKSVRASAERIHGMADQLEAENAPAYAFFSSDADDIFVFEALAHTVGNISSLGPGPYLRPLRAAPRSLRAAVLVADRATAKVLIATGDLVEEVGGSFSADIGKSNYGGFSGYEEHGVRAKAEEASAKIWRDAGALILEKHLERPFDYLAIGGHDETVDEIGRTLHPYLGRLYRASFTANPNTLSLAAIRSELADQADQVRRERDAALAGRVCDTAWSDGLAVLGLPEVLAACNSQAVETLVVAGGFTRPGSVCNSCGFLARTGEVCTVCGSNLFEVEDVVAAAMESTVRAGGRVQQIVVASPLDRHGAGALTRFPSST